MSGSVKAVNGLAMVSHNPNLNRVAKPKRNVVRVAQRERRIRLNYSATIWVGSRIASHIDAPGRDQLPHLFCSWPELR
ncbi:hypothetical protein, partial [Bradyrhizobium sp. Mp19]|uniref:hypothetical protein n=1 Tax=Bradyrhizobium sp. Mp19 TaxID=3042156 RepID=UPI0024852CC3